eukprot:scaffold309383_cov18-Prasinocladus_malaysianus.AAC.1
MQEEKATPIYCNPLSADPEADGPEMMSADGDESDVEGEGESTSRIMRVESFAHSPSVGHAEIGIMDRVVAQLQVDHQTSIYMARLIQTLLPACFSLCSVGEAEGA